MAGEDVLIQQAITLMGLIAFCIVGAGTIIVFLIWLLRKRQIWPLIVFGIRGGSLLAKGEPDNSISFAHSGKPIAEAKWTVKDQTTGKPMIIVQPITKVWHTLKGTSNPIHFCPYNTATNISIINPKDSGQISVKENNVLLTAQYGRGFADATMFKTVGGFPIDKATLFMLFIVGLLLIVLVAINLQVLSVVSPVAPVSAGG